MTKTMETNFNKLLSTTFVLAQKIHNIHWNMTGKEFIFLHKATDVVYEGLNEFIDQIAEKIIMQGGKPVVTLVDYIKHSVIKEVTKNTFTCLESVDIISIDLDVYAKLVSSIDNNEFTQPMIDEILLFVDKQRWIFNSSK